MGIRASVFIATSLDGYIAGADGRIDWLERANSTVPPGEDCGFGDFIASVDVLVMGRNSFEQVLTFGHWPYGDKRVVVLSSTELVIPAHLTKTVSWSSEAPMDLTARLAAEGAQHLYVDGGVTIQRFLAAGLIDELTITVIPIILGGGKPLFGSLPHHVEVRHLGTSAFAFGFVQSKYRVIRGVS